MTGKSLPNYWVAASQSLGRGERLPNTEKSRPKEAAAPQAMDASDCSRAAVNCSTNSSVSTAPQYDLRHLVSLEHVIRLRLSAIRWQLAGILPLALRFDGTWPGNRHPAINTGPKRRHKQGLINRACVIATSSDVAGGGPDDRSLTNLVWGSERVGRTMLGERIMSGALRRYLGGPVRGRLSRPIGLVSFSAVRG